MPGTLNPHYAGSIVYPLVTDLGHGVHRVTLPLPWALEHVHCYAIADPDGWTIVDAGLGGDDAETLWSRALARLGAPAVRRIVLTHYHPDHLGASATLAALTGAGEIVQGARDREDALWAWGDGWDASEFERYLHAHGMPDAVAGESAREEGRIPVELAAPTRLVAEGDVIDIGGEAFRVLELPGHADGHIALHGERTGRLFGGDVILEEISPNIGRWERGDPDPLGRYLESLERLARLAPSVCYPGHRRPVEDVTLRASELTAHHAARLDKVEAALGDDEASAWEVAVRVFGGRLDAHSRRFALAEALAHLERLAALGRVHARADGESVSWRRARPRAAA